ncbi:hypothetical protein THRCLA_09034 [Thraustotheca clavata]|uniref:F-box/LRR-repeat protein 15-like leucin rich repeat domain-containing protein n=1 Tax=Thraustotheca clavata TaxID=74557 RepID=A0A1V9YZT1_9STRA|nr:hypothetical protein THRCLA_09034 [Thraustotheca clavata]
MGIVCSVDESVLVRNASEIQTIQSFATQISSKCTSKKKKWQPMYATTLVELCLDQLAFVLTQTIEFDMSKLYSLPPELSCLLIKQLIQHQVLSKLVLKYIWAHLRRIEHLDLTGAKVIDSSWLQPEMVASLTHLDLSKCHLITKLPCELLSVRFVSLRGCRNIVPTTTSLLSNASNLTVLNLSQCSRISNESLASLHSCKRLTQLDLSDCRSITNSGLFYLPGNIKILNLENCVGISDRGVLAATTVMKSLVALNLAKCAITNGSMSIIRIHATQLQELTITGCRVIDQNGIDALDTLSQLRIFNCDNCQWINGPNVNWTTLTQLNMASSHSTDEGLKSISNLPNLTWLNLTSCQATDEAFKHLQNLTNIRRLILSDSSLSDKSLQLLSSKLHALEYFDIGCTYISDAGVQSLKQLNRLNTLILSSEGITYHSLPSLGTLIHLRHLDLFQASIADKGLEHLLRLQKLQQLVLCGGCLTDFGVKIIVQVVPSLTELNISQNRQIHGQSLQQIASLSKLRLLNISHTSIDSPSLIYLHRTYTIHKHLFLTIA